MNIQTNDILKVIIFFETIKCIVDINDYRLKKFIVDETTEEKKDLDIKCTYKCKRISTNLEPINNFYLGYIILANKPESYYKFPDKKLYLKEIVLTRQENESIYNLMLPDIGIIPDNKIIFTNNLYKYRVDESLYYYNIYNPFTFNNYISINDKLLKLTLHNYNNVCSEYCMCANTYTIILKETNSNPQQFCLKYIWKN